jgi:hypothetical protein
LDLAKKEKDIGLRSSLKGNIEKECLCGAVEVVEERKKFFFAILLVYNYIYYTSNINYRSGGVHCWRTEEEISLQQIK